MSVGDRKIALVGVIAAVVGTVAALAGVAVAVGFGIQAHHDAHLGGDGGAGASAHQPTSASPAPTPSPTPTAPRATSTPTKPITTPPSPTNAAPVAMRTVTLAQLCYAPGISMPSQGNCYEGGGTVGFSNGSIAWGLEADTSRDGITWIEFPATSCRSISLVFGEPSDIADVEPAITATIKQSGVTHTAQAAPGVIGHLDVDLTGEPWKFSLVSAPVSSDPYNWTVFVSGTAQCATATGV